MNFLKQAAYIRISHFQNKQVSKFSIKNSRIINIIAKIILLKGKNKLLRNYLLSQIIKIQQSISNKTIKIDSLKNEDILKNQIVFE